MMEITTVITDSFSLHQRAAASSYTFVWYCMCVAAGSFSPTEKLCYVITVCAIYKSPDSAPLMFPL